MIQLAPHIFVILYTSFFSFDGPAYCENAVIDTAVTGVIPSMTVGGLSSPRTTAVVATREGPLVSGVMCHSINSSLGPEDHDALVTESGEKVVSTKGRKPRNLNATAAATTTASTKPKVQLMPTGTKAPQRLSGVTKPAKPGGGSSGLKNLWKPRNMTMWPKPDKRLSDGARKPLPPATVVAAAASVTAAAANQTDESVVVADFKARYPIDMWKEHGFYTDDYMQLINSHWFKFEPPNAMSHYILGSLYTAIMLFGCFGNFLVIFMYIKLVCARRKLSTYTLILKKHTIRDMTRRHFIRHNI